MASRQVYQVQENRRFVARPVEQTRLRQLAELGEASAIVVYGRRRVGKTELIEQTLRKRNLLKFEGVEGQGESIQKRLFLSTLAKYAGNAALAEISPDISWFEAFELLAEHVKRGIWTVYLEELQWMADYKPDLVAQLKPIWDNHLRKNPKLILVLCGSSPSFFTTHVLRSKAFYNRALYELKVEEFSPRDAAAFGKTTSTKELFNRYLTVGGIPQYLKLLGAESSAYLGFCKNAFLPNSFFSTEFDRILVSNFSSSSLFRQILEFIGQRRFVRRDEILRHLKAKSSGGISERLTELEQCGFVRSYAPLEAKLNPRLRRYEIADAYLRAYFRTIRPYLAEIQRGDFAQNPTKPLPLSEYTKMLGYAFEFFCRKHAERVATILGFSAVTYKAGAQYMRGKDKTNANYQVDLLFQRNDRVWTVCEIKYQDAPVDRSIIAEVEAKLRKLEPPRNVTVHKVLISASGVNPSLVREPYFDRVIRLDELL